jgi:hypothetical protein
VSSDLLCPTLVITSRFNTSRRGPQVTGWVEAVRVDDVVAHLALN